MQEVQTWIADKPAVIETAMYIVALGFLGVLALVGLALALTALLFALGLVASPFMIMSEIAQGAIKVTRERRWKAWAREHHGLLGMIGLWFYGVGICALRPEVEALCTRFGEAPVLTAVASPFIAALLFTRTGRLMLGGYALLGGAMLATVALAAVAAELVMRFGG